jgi:hypothetical protein
MTEDEWLHGSEYREMYNSIKRRISTRKVRLYMAASCRLESANFFDPAITNSVETAERCSNDPEVEATVCKLDSEHTIAPFEPLGGDLGSVITNIWRLALEMPSPPDIDDDAPYSSVEAAVAHAALLSLRNKPQTVFTGGAGDAAEYCSYAIEQAALVRLGAARRHSGTSQQQRRTQLAGILRDLIGNPFRTVTVDPRWRTSDVTELARAIYEDRAFDRMPILADALMDAGCTDEQILGHCRGAGPHVRGCWVVDLVLGKE